MQQNVDQIEYSTLNNCKGLQDLKISVKYVPGWLGMFEGIIIWFDSASAFSCQNQTRLSFILDREKINMGVTSCYVYILV